MTNRYVTWSSIQRCPKMIRIISCWLYRCDCRGGGADWRSCERRDSSLGHLAIKWAWSSGSWKHSLHSGELSAEGYRLVLNLHASCSSPSHSTRREHWEIGRWVISNWWVIRELVFNKHLINFFHGSLLHGLSANWLSSGRSNEWRLQRRRRRRLDLVRSTHCHCRYI